MSRSPSGSHEQAPLNIASATASGMVIDQYQVSTDKRSGITSDPNRADDPQYILRLSGR